MHGDKMNIRTDVSSIDEDISFHTDCQVKISIGGRPHVAGEGLRAFIAEQFDGFS